MQYPHWLMVAGAVLVVLGFIGFAFSQNKNGATVDERTHEAELKAKGTKDGRGEHPPRNHRRKTESIGSRY